MRGDVVLFHSTGSILDRIITWITRPGDFSHVEIDLGEGRFIGAQMQGVNIHGADPGKHTVSFSPKASSQSIEVGLRWAKDQLGDGYGYADNASDLIGFFGWKVIIGAPKTYNCSNFVTRYLKEAGAAGPLGALADNPSLISPNDLARAFGMVKSK